MWDQGNTRGGGGGYGGGGGGGYGGGDAEPQTAPRRRPSTGGGYTASETVTIIQDRSLARKYSTLIDLVNTYGLDVKEPEFVLIGVQSCGKSAVLNQLVGRAVAKVQAGIGTRCRVKYIFRNDKEKWQPECKVNGTVCLLEGLYFNVAEIMNGIRDKQQGFSDREIVIEISVNNLPNMTVYDCPGLTPEGSDPDLAEFLEELVEPLFNNNNIIPIVVRNPSEKVIHKTTIFEVLDRIAGEKRKNWRNDSVFVATNFDLWSGVGAGGKNVKQPPTQEEILEFFNDMESNCEPSSFVVVSTNPGNEDINRIQEGPSKDAFLKSVRPKEQKFFTDLFRKAKLKDDHREKCGLPQFTKVVGEKVDAIVRNYGDTIKREMRVKMQSLRDALERARKAKEVCNPTKLRNELQQFNIKFRHWTKLYNNSHYSSRKMFPLERHGLSFTDEMDEFRASAEFSKAARVWAQDNGFFSKTGGGYEKLIGLLKTNEQGEIIAKIQRKATGMVSVERALAVWVFMMVATPFPHFTQDDIWDAAVPMHSSNRADYATGVRNIAALALLPIKESVTWLACYMRFIFRRSANIVFDRLMETEFAHLKAYQHLLQQNSYVDIINTMVDDFKNSAMELYGDVVSITKEDLAKKFTETAKGFGDGGGGKRGGGGGGGKKGKGGGDSDPDAWRAKIESKIGPLGFFDGEKISAQFMKMLPTSTPANVPEDDENFCEEIVVRSFEHYRVFKFMLMELIYTMALTRVVNKANEESGGENAIDRNSVVGPKDRESEILIRKLATSYGIEDVNALGEWLEQNGRREKGFMSMSDDDLLAASNIDPGQLEADFREAQREFSEFMDQYNRARPMF